MLGGDGGADSPSATIVSSAAARRQPIIPRPATAGSTPWALRPQPEGEFVPSRLSRRIHVARLQKEWTVEDLAKAVQVEPGMIARFESGEDYPRERSVLEALQAALGEEDAPLQLAARPRTGRAPVARTCPGGACCGAPPAADALHAALRVPLAAPTRVRLATAAASIACHMLAVGFCVREAEDETHSIKVQSKRALGSKQDELR